MTAADTGDRGLRERKKERRRQAIHETALRLVEEQGLDATTVEQICDEVGVSPRTFFNYFPSKSAAVLGLPEQLVPPGIEARFRAARGGLVSALCELIGDSMYLGVDRHRLKELVIRQPELLPAFSQWMMTVKEELSRLAEERALTPADAGAAVTLVQSALSLMVHDDASPERPAAIRLREAVDRLVRVDSAAMTEAAEA